MQVGDRVRTKLAQSSYGYEKPVCVIVAKKTRIDGMYFEIMDPEGNTKRWWPEDLEIVQDRPDCGIIDTPTKDTIMTLSARELSLLSNTDVLGYIQAQNAARDAQAKAEGWTFWTNMSEELATEHANVYELELRFARGTYADAHKDAWGIKGYTNPEHTLEQIEAEIEELAEMAAEEFKAEQEWLAEQQQMERDQIALGLTDTMGCGEEVELEQWEVYEAKAEEVGHGA